MDNPSLKKTLISSYCAMPTTEALANNSIIVVTPCGIITGNPLLDNESDNTIKLMEDLNIRFAKNYREDFNIPINMPLSGNDGFFTLKDASLISGSVTTSLGFINIFYDQVIGISLGNLNK